MKTVMALWVVLGLSAGVFAQAQVPAAKARLWRGEGILESIENARVTGGQGELQLVRMDARWPMRLVFARSEGLGVQREQDQWWVLPLSVAGARIEANHGLWALPLEARSKDHSWHVEFGSGRALAIKTDSGLMANLDADQATLHAAEARPHSDPLGNRFSVQVAGAPELQDALAGFYWGTMLPSVVEKTMAAQFPYSSGYVLSTLNVKAYAGSYPAVDHEFQIKGRLAIGSELDLDVVKRMLALQFQLMKDDPERLYRAPTSVQPDGMREYHVRRSSLDDRQNAAMFPLTGNIEVIEEAWHYYEARKDAQWLGANIENLEHAADWTVASIDPYGRVWSDVYYEDQVIKDGRETQAQAFAAYTFGLLASMERSLGREEKVAHYAGISKQIADALIAPLPLGYWDEKNQRFVDWVDRLGVVHDHIHLLANELPVMFGYATPDQARAVRQLVEAHRDQFERFPSFLSADIAAYSKAEIGNGGPYDLSAAGRYWYWDAAFRYTEKQNDVLLQQLKAVAAEAAKNDNYYMGERYDMDYVYYIDGKNAHGAEKYYEYPNVYSAVLISKLLGLTVPADADLSVAPHLNNFATVEMSIPEYGVRYQYDGGGFLLKNLADHPRHFTVDLSALGPDHVNYRREHGAGEGGTHFAVTLAAQEEVRWVPVP